MLSLIPLKFICLFLDMSSCDTSLHFVMIFFFHVLNIHGSLTSVFLVLDFIDSFLLCKEMFHNKDLLQQMSVDN